MQDYERAKMMIKTLVFNIFREAEEHEWVKTADTYSQLLSKL